MAILLWWVRAHVDYKLGVLWGAPVVALALAMGATHAALIYVTAPSSDLWLAVHKAVLFSVVYGGGLLVLERDRLGRIWKLLVNHILRSGDQLTNGSST
jgi:hypothetical protein